MKHTPGPWHFKNMSLDLPNRRHHAYFIYGNDERFPVAEMIVGAVQANAKLIAAAPDLLEALENVLAVIHSNSGIAVFDLISINKAIAKAKGEAK